MNSFQKLQAIRQQRKFSHGDGVSLSNDPNTKGIIFSIELHNSKPTYYIKEQNGDTVFSGDDDTLTSEPSLNQGKYGGPSRGGTAGGWCGGNNYHI